MREVRAVPFGTGLDRTTGALAADPASFADLRNVLLKEGRLEVRQGLTVPVTGFSGLPVCTDVVGLFPFRAIKGAVAVGYNRTTRELSLYRLDGNGGLMWGIGTWATLADGAGLPIISAAEAKGKLFLAHDEPLYNYRAQSIYYDPSLEATGIFPPPPAVANAIVPLTADFDGDSVEEAVYFRGFRAYLAYMWGWGHGAASRPNAPEVLRYSEGANPTVWPKNYYFICGAADDAVTNAGAAGSTLLVCKGNETFVVFGDNPQNFGIRSLELVHGTVNSRMGVELGGAFFYWSETGPRVSTGGVSIDLGIPLDLDGPSPAGLAEAGQDKYGWCVHDPLRRLILWGFPVLDDATATATRVYCLSVRDPEQLRWSYVELGQSIYSVGNVTLGAPVVGTTMTGYASNVGAVDAGVYQTGRQVQVSWTNNAAIGGEYAQILRRMVGSLGWETAGEVPVSGASQSVIINGPNMPWQALADYEVAVYFLKNFAFTSGFGPNPDNWTHAGAAGAKTTVTTLCEAPVITLGSWSRTGADTQQALFAVTLAELGIQFNLEETTEPPASWAEVATWVEPGYPADQRPAQLVYNPPIAEMDSYRNFRIRAYRDGKYSGYSNIYKLWLGPAAPVGGATSFVFQDTNTNDFLVFLKDQPYNAISYAQIEIEAREEGTGPWTRVYLGGGNPTPVAMPIDSLPSPAAFDNVTKTEVRARYALSLSGVWDWGEWSQVETILLTNEAPPASPAAFTGTTYNDVADIDATFAAGGALGRLMYYRDGLAIFGLPETYTFAEVDGAATSVNFADLAHWPVGQQQGVITDVGALPWLGHLAGYDWDYAHVTGTQAAPEYVASYAINRAGGRAKISATPTADTISKVLANPPNGISVTKTGPGQLQVGWTNNRPTAYRTFVQILYPGALDDNCNPLGPPPAYPAFQLVGPPSGYVALPPVPTDIVVRIWQSEILPYGAGYFEHFTAYVDTPHTMS